MECSNENLLFRNSVFKRLFKGFEKPYSPSDLLTLGNTKSKLNWTQAPFFTIYFLVYRWMLLWYTILENIALTWTHTSKISCHQNQFISFTKFEQFLKAMSVKVMFPEPALQLPQFSKKVNSFLKVKSLY